MKKFSLLLGIVLLFVSATAAQAAIVTYDFSGMITSGNVFGVGQAFTGSLSYDPSSSIQSTTYQGANPSERTDYSVFSNAAAITLSVNGNTVSNGNIMNTFILPYHALSMTVISQYGPAGTMSEFNINGNLAGGGFAGAFQESLTYAAQFDIGGTGIYGLSRIGGSHMYNYNPLAGQSAVSVLEFFEGSITSVTENPTPTPIPAAVWLLGSGLMGLVGFKRSRKTSSAA